MSRPKSPPGNCQDCGQVATLIGGCCRRCYDHRRNSKQFCFEAAQIKEVEGAGKTWQTILSTIKRLKLYSPGFEKFTIEDRQYGVICEIAVEKIEASAERERLEHPEIFGELLEGEVVGPEADTQPHPDNKVEPEQPGPQPQPENKVEVGQQPPQPQPSTAPPPQPFVSQWLNENCRTCEKPTYSISPTIGTCESGHRFTLTPNPSPLPAGRADQ